MSGRVWFDLVLAIFATIGFFGSMRWLIERIFGTDKIILAIEILTQRDADSAEILIRDALFQYLRTTSNKVVIFTTRELMIHPELRRAAKEYGISCIISEEFASENL